MIGISNQFIMKISVGDKKDFLRTENLLNFTLIEECGNLLPKWKISFRMYDSSLQAYWHEGNIINISYGKNQFELVDTQLVITEKSIIPEGGNRFIFSAVGLFSALNFVNTPHTRTLGPFSAAEVVNGIAAQYFKLDRDNLRKSEDKQIFVQPNIIDKRFLDDVVNMCYLKNSFVGYGITSDGRYILKNVKNEISKGFKYRFTQQTQDAAKDITYISAPVYNSNSSFINSWIGYGREKSMYSSESGDVLFHKPDTSPILSLANKLQRNKQIEKSNLTRVLYNRNMDKNAHVALSNNKTKLALLSSDCLQLTFVNIFKPISIWDVVMVKDSNPDNTTNHNISGLYITGLVSRSILGANNFRLETTVKLFREASNEVSGSVR